MIRVPDTDLKVLPGGSSLLAQSAHEKVSPTCAEPKEGGSPRLVERMKSWSVASLGYAEEADCGILLSLSCGSGCCWASDGRESLILDEHGD